MSLRPWLATAALVAVFAFAAPPAAFAAADESAACTVGGVAVPDGSPMPKSIPTVISCFDSVEAAEQFIEVGAPGDYEKLNPMSRSTSHAATATTATTVIVGTAWTGASRSGTALIHWGSGSGCYGVTYGFPSLASTWDNNVRSAEGSNNCWSSQYDGASYTGSVITCAPYCATLGTLSAKTSSIVYRPVGTWG